MSLKNCPDCGGDLGRGAVKCRCGWTVPGTSGPAKTGEIPCAADKSCRYSGRMWLRTLAPTERVCVNHYYLAIDQDRSMAHDNPVPPKGGVFKTAKPVSGS